MDEKYYSFPSVKIMAMESLEFYKGIGLGYRAEFIKRLSEEINGGFDLTTLTQLKTPDLKKELLNIHGVGPKVADCVTLFGFSRSDSFPVDTWMEKVYREDFKGTLKDRKKIADWFVDKFKGDAGFYQQYLFYYKRTLSNQ
jgi:N-glycosylase/DNA lyase